MHGEISSRTAVRILGESAALLMKALIGSALLVAFLTGQALAQAVAQPPSTQSPHWSHIRIYDFGRGLSMSQAYPQDYQWFATHVDAAEVHGNASNLKNYNSTMKLSRYDLDLSTFADGSSMGVPEDYFLHFSEDTQIQFLNLERTQTIETVNIKGCPVGTAITSSCRVVLYLWTDKRWVYNVGNTAFQQWKAGRLLGSTVNFYGVSTGKTDMLWLDEHAPGFAWPFSWGYQNIPLKGGGIREFGGLRPGTDQMETAYSNAVAAWLSYLALQAKQIGEKVLINVNAQALHPWMVPQVNAIAGMDTESKHRPDGYTDGNEYLASINQVKSSAAKGGVIDLHGIWCHTGPTGYTAGNYGSTGARYHMWRLASYYQFKEPAGSPGLVYFNPAFCSNQNMLPQNDAKEWLKAYEVNVGQPSGDTTLYQQGTAGGCFYKIFSRSYSNNAQILVRPQDGASCTNYGNTTSVSLSFPQGVFVLREDGTLSAAVTAVQIRNAEALILFTSPVAAVAPEAAPAPTPTSDPAPTLPRRLHRHGPLRK